MKGLVIEQVTPGSIADEMEIAAGDRLIAINGHPLRDIIDYSYYSAYDDVLLLELEKLNGEIWEVEIEREPGETLGLFFPAPIPTKCSNNCIFCFVHQLPKRLRKSLYVKDEDYRLSFLNGNYVTLANLKKNELKRITEQRLSPLYISVHATNPQLREKLLGRPGIPPIMDQLRRLANARIAMHTQVVLCPGINDDTEFERTVNDLSALYPAVQSLAVVPIGLTDHRQHLPQLVPVTKAYAAAFINRWQPEAMRIKKQLGEPFLFLADEFYLKAALPFPPLKEYGDLPQIENGVGLVPQFMHEASMTLRKARQLGDFTVTVVTGKSSFSFVQDFLKHLSCKTGVKICPVAVKNRLFGESITVSGLISGNDIVESLKGNNIGNALLVPEIMIKEGAGIFLDDMSVERLAHILACQVFTFEPTPMGFYNILRQLDTSGKCSPPK